MSRLKSDRRLWIELFCLLNLAFLVVDVWIAHEVNDFAVPAEWIPVYFAAAGSAALAGAMLSGHRRTEHWIGMVVGAGAIVVGVAGMLLHLENSFFAHATLHNLVYTAPFAAPLAFAGLGLLLLLDRLVRPGTVEWSRWLVLLALGGWIGNFALALADHAQNGFFDPWEWVPVGAAAFAIGFLGTALFRPDRRLLRAGLVLMALEVVVALVGFGMHTVANLQESGSSLANRFLYGAPAFAPLLYADLALLSAIALYSLGHPEPDHR